MTGPLLSITHKALDSQMSIACRVCQSFHMTDDPDATILSSCESWPVHLRHLCHVDGVTVLGMPGWRGAFLCVAAVSAATGAATLKLARDPQAAGKEPAGLLSMFGHLRSFFTIPTFVIIVVQASPC